MIKKILKWSGVAVLIYFGAARDDRKKVARILDKAEPARNRDE